MKSIIFFDLGGILYQTHINLIKAVKSTCDELKMEYPSIDKIKDCIGSPQEIFCDQIFKTTETKIRQSFNTNERKSFSGVKSVVKELYQRGYELWICSNGSFKYIDDILKKTDIKTYFTGILSHERGMDKSTLIKKFLEKNNIDDAMIIGDKEDDVRAGVENNLLIIGAKYRYGEKELAQADYFINSINDLIPLINKIEIFKQIQKHIKLDHEPYVIGINGVDTSGKTSFANDLKDYLTIQNYAVQVIHMDDFHYPSQIRNQGEDPVESYFKYAFNLHVLEESLLKGIKRGKIIDKELHLLNLESDQYNRVKQYRIKKDTIVIIEGVLLYREPINQYIDYRIFLDIPFSEVLRRARLRDVPKYGIEFLKKYETKYIPIQKKYLQLYKPKEISDLVIDNTNFDYPKIK